MSIHRRGLLFVVSSPSGAGKTTLCNKILAADDNLTLSISATTRPKRHNEVDGQDYYFVTHEQFAEMRDTGDFLEHATVFENSYGTPREPVETALTQGRDILFDIDWQGAQQLDEVARQDVVKVFILPPSRQVLMHRLQNRASDAEAVILKRMNKANDEISHWAEYDYVIINNDLDLAEAELKAILQAERLQRRRQTGMSDFVKSLMAQAE